LNSLLGLSASRFQALRVVQPARGDEFAVLPGVNFQDGVIEADMAIEITRCARPLLF